jgi:hypothetical protein
MKNNYHVCYIIGKELCTGININADGYSQAIKEFEKRFPDKEILYVSKIN